MARPEVSVVIPCHNAGRFLATALDSVLAQTFADREVLLVDDGSTDDTAERARAYRGAVQYHHQANAGVSVARNRGIEQSRGRYLAFLDADDAWHPAKLERQVQALGQQRDARASHTGLVIADAELRPLPGPPPPPAEGRLEQLLMLGNVLSGGASSMVCERSLFDEVGRFDPQLSLCADWEMWIRIASVTRFALVAEPLCTYRRHPQNMSRNVRLLESDSLGVLERAFAMPSLPAPLRALRRRAFARNYMVLAGSYFGDGALADFARCAWRAVALDWRQAGYLFGFPARVAARRGTRRRPASA